MWQTHSERMTTVRVINAPTTSRSCHFPSSPRDCQRASHADPVSCRSDRLSPKGVCQPACNFWPRDSAYKFTRANTLRYYSERKETRTIGVKRHSFSPECLTKECTALVQGPIWPEDSKRYPSLVWETRLNDFLKDFIDSFLERGEGREGGREKLMCERNITSVVASRMPPARDLAHNPGMCPDWESNQRPFGSQAGAQPTRAISATAKWFLMYVQTLSLYIRSVPTILIV